MWDFDKCGYCVTLARLVGSQHDGMWDRLALCCRVEELKRIADNIAIDTENWIKQEVQADVESEKSGIALRYFLDGLIIGAIVTSVCFIYIMYNVL